MKNVMQITNKYLKLSLILVFLIMLYNCGTHKNEKRDNNEIGGSEKVIAGSEFSLVETSNSDFLSIDNIKSKDTWELVKMNGKSAKDLFDKVPTLSFDKAESRVQGFAGCNRYSGGFALEGNKFIISRLVTTRMMCQNKNDEYGFTQAMESVNIAKYEGNNLFLFKDGQLILEFVKK
ncbi:META domain-containing protein [Apibacter raozihei]|uniref:META domain-containing protein n=1 Tax=Apibacter raozihei TaxID=2500547 RepID=UPI000FE43EA5|nr:META domain-containing protein [Apibacter raozihei]